MVTAAIQARRWPPTTTDQVHISSNDAASATATALTVSSTAAESTNTSTGRSRPRIVDWERISMVPRRRLLPDS